MSKVTYFSHLFVRWKDLYDKPYSLAKYIETVAANSLYLEEMVKILNKGKDPRELSYQLHQFWNPNGVLAALRQDTAMLGKIHFCLH
jgi:hypothetical protein